MTAKQCKKGKLVYFKGDSGRLECGYIQWVLNGTAVLTGASFSGIVDRPVSKLYATAEAYFGK